MSTPTKIEVEDVQWFPRYGPMPVAGDCDHRCSHRSQKVIAWGPTMRAYELVECTDCGCRVWFKAREGGNGGERPSGKWQKVQR